MEDRGPMLVLLPGAVKRGGREAAGRAGVDAQAGAGR